MTTTMIIILKHPPLPSPARQHTTHIPEEENISFYGVHVLVTEQVGVGGDVVVQVGAQAHVQALAASGRRCGSRRCRGRGGAAAGGCLVQPGSGAVFRPGRGEVWRHVAMVGWLPLPFCGVGR